MQVKGSMVFENSILFGTPYFTPSFYGPPAFSHMSAHLWCTCVDKQHGALLCWDLLMGIQGYNHFVSVVGLVKGCNCQGEWLTIQAWGHYSDLPVLDFIPVHAFHVLIALHQAQHLQFLLWGSCLFHACTSISIVSNSYLLHGQNFGRECI